MICMTRNNFQNKCDFPYRNDNVKEIMREISVSENYEVSLFLEILLHYVR